MYSTKKKTRSAVGEYVGIFFIIILLIRFFSSEYYISHFSPQFIVVLNLLISVLNQEVDVFLPVSSPVSHEHHPKPCPKLRVSEQHCCLLPFSPSPTCISTNA